MRDQKSRNVPTINNNKYNLQGVFGKYVHYSYTCDRTTTTDMMSIKTKDTAATNDEIESDDPSNRNTRAAPNNISEKKDATKTKLLNEIKALSGREFIGDELTTYGDAIGKKKEGMIRILGLNTNSIQLDEIRSTCQESIDQQVDIQCFQEVCRDMRNSTVLQRFLIDTKKSDKESKSVWGASEINIGNDYKPGGTAMAAFGKIIRRVIQQGIDDLGRWSWIAFKGEDNKVILIMSIYQCCKNPTNPQRKTAYHQQETMLSERNRNNCDPRQNFYKDT